MMGAAVELGRWELSAVGRNRHSIVANATKDNSGIDVIASSGGCS
jgi:hypothetical protein